LRATAGTAFRAPTIAELFDGLGRSAPSYYDPCDASDYAQNHGGNGTNVAPGCAQVANRTDTQTTSLIGGNAELTPETADTYTAGFVFTPEVGDSNLSLTVDWWKIEMEDAISSYGVQYILNQCYIEGNQDLCSVITRRADADYTIREIIDGNANVSSQTGSGIDTEVRYNFDAGSGTIDLALLWSHMLEREKTALPGSDPEDLLGRHTNSTAEDGGTYAEDKFNFTARYYAGNFSVGYLAEYISSVDATATYQDYTYAVPSLLYHDLMFDYSFDVMGTTRLSVGLTNLTDEEPPYIDPGFNANTDPNTYRMFGRGYFVRLTQSF
jgi:outer membrane receptor protein involved in Fe transport